MNSDFFPQVDKTLKNRERRFKFLMSKERSEDAIAVAEEFVEWIDPDNVEDIFYVDMNEMEALYAEKSQS